MKVIIEIDKPFEDVLPPGTDPDDYEESVKNGVVLTNPNAHPPDVEVTVETDD